MAQVTYPARPSTEQEAELLKEQPVIRTSDGRIRVFHGTVDVRRRSIKRHGLVPRNGEDAFVTGNEYIAWRYAQIRTVVNLVHFGGPNRGLLVIAEVPERRLTRIPKKPPEGHYIQCIGFSDGWWVAGGVRPHEIVEFVWASFPDLCSPEGVRKVYGDLVVQTVDGEVRGAGYLYDQYEELRRAGVTEDPHAPDLPERVPESEAFTLDSVVHTVQRRIARASGADAGSSSRPRDLFDVLKKRGLDL